MISQVAGALSDRYRIERELGAGGMARVYLATDLKHQRQVAIKVLRPELAEALGAERFLAEIRLTATLQHPHILALFDSGDVDGVPYYVMPFVDGESLRERLRRDGRVPVAEALALAADVAAALTFAHGHGVVHRDIKPENILIKDGEALVADFGIALAVAKVGGERVTQTGISLGTPAYMSPEQIGGDRQLDGRADQFALAVILYEMLAGTPPFQGPTAQAIFARTLTEEPPTLASRGVTVPAAIEGAIRRALAKTPDERFATAREFIGACVPPVPAAPRSRWPLAVGGVALLVAAVSGVGFWWSQGKARAIAALPQIRALANEGNYAAAFALAAGAGRHLGGDSTYRALFDEVTDELSVKSEPSGAEVYLATFGDSTVADSSDGVRIGTTPIVGHVVARGDHRIVVRASAHEPVRRIVSRFLTEGEGLSAADRRIAFDLRLPRAGAVPEGMEMIPGGRYEIVGHDIGRGLTVELDSFALDRFEVSNAHYAKFVKGGGYRNASVWASSGGAVEPSRFVDRTGLPAPREWVSGEPPAGRERHPVTGVSWHEAAAYCTWRGTRLPSLFEWEKASRDGRSSRIGVLMPWGQYEARAASVVRANFSGNGTSPVDAYPFAISPYGIYNMAGNVKEWLVNRVGHGWGTAGGGWQDPMYLFSQVGSQTADGTPTLGFRCAKPLGAGRGTAGTEALSLTTATPTYTPVAASVFPSLLEHYRYDPRPANARGVTTLETPDWVRERLWIDGAKGDSLLVYLFLPRTAQPPFQTLVLIPSSAAFGQSSIPTIAEDVAAGQVKSGRAILAPVLAGMVERQGAARGRLAPNTVEFRDQMVQHATEMRLAMDYAATRGDIDSTRFAYLAISFGAGSRLPFAAVDPRFRAVVLLGAGIDERIQPTLPEAANFNFAPYLRAPTLMLNGRQDEEHPWLSRAKPLWDLLPEPKELELVEGAGHVVPVEIRTPRIRDFLDRTLGPVVAKGK